LKIFRLAGFALLALGLALPAWAADKSATISGVVRNAAGAGQMGAVIEVLGVHTAQAVTVFSDDHGYFSAPGLLPGVYRVRVSAASFLPSLFENVKVRAGAHRVMNVTMNTLWEAVLSMPRRQSQADDDDWKWTLRSAANRPILRLRNGDPVVVVRDASDRDAPLKARVAFVAGGASDGFTGGSNDVRTVF
jgi:Carboxypeptidase regulatory-like domain